MLFYLLAFVGGVLTIASPCILPVLPFVFSRADQPFRRSGLAAAGGDGGDVCGGGGRGDVCGRMGCARKSDWKKSGDHCFCGAWTDAAVAGLAEYLSRPFVRLGGRVQGRKRRGAEYWTIAVTGSFHGIAVGAVRRADSGIDFGGGGTARTERAHHIFVAGICGGSGDFAGAGVAGRESKFSRR